MGRGYSAVNKAAQAKHVGDEAVLAAVRAAGADHPARWAMIWDVQAALPTFPPKVVRAKLAALVRRGVLDGCTCGCRGDFFIKAEVRP